MYKFTFILCLVLLTLIKSEAQQRTDTVKCYVQLMVPSDGALGIGRNIENNALFMSGGMFIYTRAYGVKDSTGKYFKFLNSRKKELKDIWWPESGPVVMRKDW